MLLATRNAARKTRARTVRSERSEDQYDWLMVFEIESAGAKPVPIIATRGNEPDGKTILTAEQVAWFFGETIEAWTARWRKLWVRYLRAIDPNYMRVP